VRKQLKSELFGHTQTLFVFEHDLFFFKKKEQANKQISNLYVMYIAMKSSEKIWR
jgi:hypothetical protein